MLNKSVDIGSKDLNLQDLKYIKATPQTQGNNETIHTHQTPERIKNRNEKMAFNHLSHRTSTLMYTPDLRGRLGDSQPDLETSATKKLKLGKSQHSRANQLPMITCNMSDFGSNKLMIIPGINRGDQQLKLERMSF